MTPGPGAYNTPSKLGSGGKKLSFLEKTKIQLNTNSSTPGPGSYEIPKFGLNKNQSFPKGERFPPIKKDTSSDFVTLPSSLSKKGAKIGSISSRSLPQKLTATPGPGSYKILSEFGDIK